MESGMDLLFSFMCYFAGFVSGVFAVTIAILFILPGNCGYTPRTESPCNPPEELIKH